MQGRFSFLRHVLAAALPEHAERHTLVSISSVPFSQSVPFSSSSCFCVCDDYDTHTPNRIKNKQIIKIGKTFRDRKRASKHVIAWLEKRKKEREKERNYVKKQKRGST